VPSGLAENVKVNNSILTLSTSGPATAGEICSTMLFGHNEYLARMKLGTTPKGLCAFFLFEGGDYSDEIDIEFYTDNPSVIQFVVWKDDGQVDIVQKGLGFDASSDFHIYGFTWAATKIDFVVDGNTIHTFNDVYNMPTDDMYLLFYCANPSYFGSYVGPTSLEVDYVEVRSA